LRDLLCQGPRTVEALADQAAISVANASQHLQVLRMARLVDAEKKGLHVEYRIADAEVRRFFFSLRTLAEARLAEVEQVTREYLEARGAMEAVASEELLRRGGGGGGARPPRPPPHGEPAGHPPPPPSPPRRPLPRRPPRPAP